MKIFYPLSLACLSLSALFCSCGGAKPTPTNAYLGDVPAVTEAYRMEKVEIHKTGLSFMDKNENTTDASVFTQFAAEQEAHVEAADARLAAGLEKARATLVNKEIPMENKNPKYTISGWHIKDIDSVGMIVIEGKLIVKQPIPFLHGTAYLWYEIVNEAGETIVDGKVTLNNPDYGAEQANEGEDYIVEARLDPYQNPALCYFAKMIFGSKITTN